MEGAWLRVRTVAIIGTRGYPSYYGGFETAIRKLSPYLADHGWRVVVYGRKGAVENGDPLADPRIESVHTSGINSKSLSTLSYGATASVHAALKRPDVALVMNVANGYWLPILRLLKIPTVMNVDGIEWEREKWSSLGKMVFRGGARLASWLADELIVDAREIGRIWRDRYGREGNFIPYGADKPPALPVEHGLNDRGYILFVARLVPDNTLPAFLEAAIDLSHKYQIVIVGSSGHGGEMERRVADLAARSERICWLGQIADEQRLLALWQHCGVYFHGHSVGGTNPSLIQAMACGAPVVARDTPYNREVLGHNGMFCAPEPQSIRVALETVMQGFPTPRSGTDRVITEYSWETVCASYDRLLTELASNRNNQNHEVRHATQRNP